MFETYNSGFQLQGWIEGHTWRSIKYYLL